MDNTINIGGNLIRLHLNGGQEVLDTLDRIQMSCLKVSGLIEQLRAQMQEISLEAAASQGKDSK